MAISAVKGRFNVVTRFEFGEIQLRDELTAQARAKEPPAHSTKTLRSSVHCDRTITLIYLTVDSGLIENEQVPPVGMVICLEEVVERYSSVGPRNLAERSLEQSLSDKAVDI